MGCACLRVKILFFEQSAYGRHAVTIRGTGVRSPGYTCNGVGFLCIARAGFSLARAHFLPASISPNIASTLTFQVGNRGRYAERLSCICSTEG